MLGCGGWGHRLVKCTMVPKVALALEYIKKKPEHVKKLITEFKRINNKTTKTGTVRTMLSSGLLDGFDDPSEFLANQDIPIEMEEVTEEDQ